MATMRATAATRFTNDAAASDSSPTEPVTAYAPNVRRRMRSAPTRLSVAAPPRSEALLVVILRGLRLFIFDRFEPLHGLATLEARHEVIKLLALVVRDGGSYELHGCVRLVPGHEH